MSEEPESMLKCKVCRKKIHEQDTYMCEKCEKYFCSEHWSIFQKYPPYDDMCEECGKDTYTTEIDTLSDAAKDV